MPRTRLVATTTVQAEVKLSPSARTMLRKRLAEHADLAKKVREMNGKRTKKNPEGGRMKRIEKEVDSIFTKEKQGAALLDGTVIDGYKVKMVLGSRSVFDKLGFMKKHGVTEADFEEFTTTKDNEPYISIKRVGEEEDE